MKLDSDIWGHLPRGTGCELSVRHSNNFICSCQSASNCFWPSWWQSPFPKAKATGFISPHQLPLACQEQNTSVVPFPSCSWFLWREKGTFGSRLTNTWTLGPENTYKVRALASCWVCRNSANDWDSRRVDSQEERQWHFSLLHTNIYVRLGHRESTRTLPQDSPAGCKHRHLRILENSSTWNTKGSVNTHSPAA